MTQYTNSITAKATKLDLDVGTVKCQTLDANTYAIAPGVIFCGTFTGSIGALTYTTLALFPYPGTTLIRSVGRVSITLRASNTNPCSVRIYDSTNAQTIAENTNIIPASGNVNALYTLSLVGSQPVNPAIFEIQVKRNGTAVSVFLTGIAVF